MSIKALPYFAFGEIVKGFGRGSKELGCPTANYPLEVVRQLPKDFQTGVYFGWANLNNGDVHKMVMNIGWCPFYNNKEKSMETHILHISDDDLYGQLLKICIVGYLRPEMNFESVEALISQIKDDIKQTDNLLEDAEYLKLENSDFFKCENNNTNGA